MRIIFLIKQGIFIHNISFPDAGNAGETMPGIDNKINLIPSNSPKYEATDTASSHDEVSCLVPQLGLSPVLAKYKQYLQSCYNARVLAPADKFLPTLESPFINLAMIRWGRYNHKQRDEFTRRTLHGGVDQILENKTPINIEDLLTPEECNIRAEGNTDEEKETITMNQKSSGTQSSQIAQYSKRTVRFILVEGPPGIGKSTFAWEICRRWDEIESLRKYHTMVLLKLREKWVLSATSLSDLLRYPSHPDFSNSIAEELVQSQGQKLLLVLDGFDEVSHSFHENSVIKSILCRQLLPECTIILTTRPVAKATLRSICQPRVDKHVEIIGFTEEERVRYITEVFSKEPELQVNFLKYMFLVPHIKSMMYIPLNCAIIAQVYEESQSSRHLAIPKTRTQLYKALTHSLLVRHMKTKENSFVAVCMLPEGLDNESMIMFKTMAKFAFDSYHVFGSNKSEPKRKVTFFKEDIPEGLVHFGFMNESTELYAGKGVEQTFSFLHLSLQEYLAAWHLADNYSIEFQVAYHRLALDCKGDYKDEETISSLQQHTSLDYCLDSDNEGWFENLNFIYKGDIKEEGSLILSLGQKRPSLVEPAIFLAGITGWKCQSKDDSNRWELYLSHDTAGVVNSNILVRSVYEAQNPALLPHYFTAERCNSPSMFLIGSETMENQDFVPDHHAAYDCYAFSYCLANSSYQNFSLSFGFNFDEDISKVETFVKGLNNYSKYTKSRIKLLVFKKSSSTSVVNRGLRWLTEATLLTTTEEICFESVINSSVVEGFLQSLVKLKSFKIYIDSPSSWQLVAALKTLKEVEVLHISVSEECSPPPTDHWKLDQKFAEVLSDTKFYSNIMQDFSPTNIQLLCLSSIVASNPITKMVLPSISCETKAGVHNILLNCPSLTTFELKKTRLGYDGILYICSALRNNKMLRYLVIHDCLQLPPSSKIKKCVESAPLPGKTTCTEFLLELNNILKDNTTLEEMKIQSGLFFPVSQGMNFELCIKSKLADELLQTFVKVQMLPNDIPLTISCECVTSESLKKERVLRITNKAKCCSENTILDISNISLLNSKAIDLVLKLSLKLNTFANVMLSKISRETMAGVHNILLHCPSLTTLELKRTRLGYDGILYLCSALRNNRTLRHLVIYDDLQLPPSRKKRRMFVNKFSSFSHFERVPLPDKTTCTEFLLELNHILKDNNTLEVMKIQSGLFLPLSAGEHGEYCQWTGLGPLQQFNVGAVGSGVSPNPRRSFSSSDVTQPQTTLFWDRQFHSCYEAREFDVGKLFLRQGKKGINYISFTVPGTEVLQSFSGLDPRLKECLEISHLHRYVEKLREDCWGMLGELAYILNTSNGSPIEYS